MYMSYICIIYDVICILCACIVVYEYMSKKFMRVICVCLYSSMVLPVMYSDEHAAAPLAP